ncbi:hypothetical protein T484DRAFT_1824568 [Baffinella frigidus]|nr:hypothetical protein T484DRAFT_1824568 [Cryptophyta sp. CCMP2293]
MISRFVTDQIADTLDLAGCGWTPKHVNAFCGIMEGKDTTGLCPRLLPAMDLRRTHEWAALTNIDVSEHALGPHVDTNIDASEDALGSHGMHSLGTNIDVSENALGSPGMHALADAVLAGQLRLKNLVRQLRLKNLNVSKNNLGATGANALVRIVKEDSNRGANGANALVRIVKEDSCFTIESRYHPCFV